MYFPHRFVFNVFSLVSFAYGNRAQCTLLECAGVSILTSCLCAYTTWLASCVGFCVHLFLLFFGRFGGMSGVMSQCSTCQSTRSGVFFNSVYRMGLYDAWF